MNNVDYSYVQVDNTRGKKDRGGGSLPWVHCDQ